MPDELPIDARLPLAGQPDPTLAVNKLVLREITQLKEIFHQRFEGYDKAIELLQKSADKEPSASMVDSKVSHLAELTEEKFLSVTTGIANQFALRDTALVAALKTQQEAVANQQIANDKATSKTELSVEKRIEGISVLLVSVQEGLNGKIDDLKTRLTSMEGVKRGGSDVYGYVFGAIMMVIALATVIVTYHH
jgi:hypothetical protein